MLLRNRSKYLTLLLGMSLLYGCAELAPKRPRIEIPVLRKKPRKKQKSPSAPLKISVSSQELYVRGQRAYYQGEYQEALNNFRLASKSDSSFMEPKIGLGQTLLDIGQYGKASEVFAAVIKYDSDYFDAYIGLGRALLNEKKYDQSLQALENALILIPHHPRAEKYAKIARKELVSKYLSSGEKKKSLGDLYGGKTDFEKVLKMEPHNARAHLQLAYILERGEKLQPAREHLDKALTEDPSDTDALRLLAKIFYQTKRLEKAQETYQRLLEIDPTDQETRTHLKAVQKALFHDPGIHMSFYKLSSAARIGRGDLAGILSMGLKTSPPEQEERIINLTDISRHWAKKHITKAVNSGLMDTASRRTFEPNNIVTRAELALTIYRIAANIDSATGLEVKEKFTPYQDIPPDHNLYKPTLYLFINRIMEGEEKHYFGANSQVPGIEALEVVDRLDDHLIKIRNKLLLEAAEKEEDKSQESGAGSQK